MSVKEDIKSKSVKEDIKSKSVKEDIKSVSVKRKYENKDIYKEINKLVILGIIKKWLSEVYSLEMVIRSLQPRNGHTQKE